MLGSDAGTKIELLGGNSIERFRAIETLPARREDFYSNPEVGGSVLCQVSCRLTGFLVSQMSVKIDVAGGFG
jgi:hypothetical protein